MLNGAIAGVLCLNNQSVRQFETVSTWEAMVLHIKSPMEPRETSTLETVKPSV